MELVLIYHNLINSVSLLVFMYHETKKFPLNSISLRVSNPNSFKNMFTHINELIFSLSSHFVFKLPTNRKKKKKIYLNVYNSYLCEIYNRFPTTDVYCISNYKVFNKCYFQIFSFVVFKVF